MKYTLAFDVYGTLINTAGVFDTLRQMTGDQAKPFMDTWRNKQLEYSFRRGLMNSYTDFSDCTKDALEYCNKVFATNLDESQKQALMDVYTVLPAFPDVGDTLHNLSLSGHKLFAFSNGSERAVTKLLANAKIIDWFDGIVSVEKVRMFKPSPIVYEYFNKLTNSSKSNSWLISGNSFDVIGAISYGMHTAWVHRSKDAIFDPWGVKPTATLSKLTDLSSILQKFV